MAAAIPELPQPGVQVVQEYTDQTPVIVIPTLVPCVVGVAKEIRELYDADGTLNSDIIVDGPAIAVAPNDQTSYTAMDALTLQVRVNGGVLQTFTMPTGASPPTTMTAQEVAIAINSAAPPPVNFAAYVLPEDSDGDGVDDKWYLELRSTATGEDTSIQVVGGTLLTGGGGNKFGWGVGQTFYGLGAYIQDAVYLKQSSFPDPRGNLDELDIDEDSIRVFVDLGTAPREFLRDESFLRRGSYYNAVGPVYGVTPVDDGDGDTMSPYVDFKDLLAVVPNFLALAGAASLTGIVDLSTFQPLHGKELILQVDGGGKQTIKFYGQPIISTDSAGGGGWAFGGFGGTTLKLLVNGVALDVLFPVVANITQVIAAINAASVAAFGVNVAYECDSVGVAGAGGYIGFFYGAQPATNIVSNTEVQVVAWAGPSASQSAIMGDLLAHYQLLGKNAGAEPVNDVVEQINAVYPSGIASWVGGTLKLLSTTSGYESKIEIDVNSTACGTPPPPITDLLGLDVWTNGYVYYGTPFPVRIGDAVYGDGTFLGNVSEIHPMATQGRIKLDREVSLTGRWQYWYFLAKNLDTVLSSQWGVTVPTPDLYLDTQGNVHLKQDFLRDIYGIPVSTARVSLYVAYTAVRLDVTSEADQPALLTFNNVTELEAALSPVTPENPLAYGVFCALGNSNGVAVSCIGVSETTADKPYGTLAGFMKAFDFLEACEVYGVGVLTQDLDVALAAQQHVDAMSEPEMKGERIACIYLGRPTRKVDTIICSGNDGDTVTGTPTYLDTAIPNLSQLLLDAGLNPASFTIADGVFIDLSADGYNWNVIGPVVGGTQLRVNTTFAPGQNDDGFYHDVIGDFPTIISGAFSVKIRGAAITDKDEEVETVYYRGQGFSDRRVWMVQLDQLKATVSGIDQLVPGFYMTAAKVGQIGGLNPSQPLTNFPIAVFTGVTGTTDRYNTTQLNKMAAGGADLIIQENANVPLTSRMQVTTRMTSIEEREQSIVKAVDYCAKFYRMSLKVYIGRYNITQAFLDTLSTVAQGLGRWLEEEGKVVAGAELNNLIQDEDNPDTVLVNVTIDPLYPCNYIVITLVV